MPLTRAAQIHGPIASASFAAGGSVLDHRFGEGDAYTLGVEEECMLLDSGARSAARTLRIVAVLAGRADRPPLLPPHDLRRVTVLRAAVSVPRLRGVRRGHRSAR
jgi:hypothetical protein